MSRISLVKDKKGNSYILSHKRCGFTECIFLLPDELNELKTLLEEIVP